MAPLRATLHYGFLPAMLVGANAAALALLVGNASRGWLLALLLVAIAISFGAERLLPYARDWNHSHDDSVRDTLHAIVNETANFSTLLFLPVFTSIFALEGAWPSHWPFPLQVLLSVLILDLGITLAHFASHRLELLWRFHAVHHSVKRMYGFNGLMKHPIHQAVETVSGTLPLIALGLPTDVASALVFAVAIQLLLQHSNVDYAVGPLRYVLAVNEVHRFHHQKDAASGDVNFGLFTTFWDHLLGTFHYEPRNEPFTSAELGIGAEPNYPTTYADQLIQPFRTSIVGTPT